MIGFSHENQINEVHVSLLIFLEIVHHWILEYLLTIFWVLNWKYSLHALCKLLHEKIWPNFVTLLAQENNWLWFFRIEKHLKAIAEETTNVRLLFLATLDLALAVLVAAVELLAQTVVAFEAVTWKTTGQHLAHWVCLPNQQAVQRLIAKFARILKTLAVRTDKVIILPQFVNILFLCLRSKLKTNLVHYLAFVLLWQYLCPSLIEFDFCNQWLGFALAARLSYPKALEHGCLIRYGEIDGLELVAYFANSWRLHLNHIFKFHELV